MKTETVSLKPNKKGGGNRFLRIFLRALAVLGVTLAVLALTLYLAMWIVVNGPSERARRLFVMSVKETSAAYFLADWYLSPEEIDEIMGKGGTEFENGADIDTSLIQIQPKPEGESAETAAPESETGEAEETEAVTETAGESSEPLAEADIGITVTDVVGATYNGKMISVSDPARVSVAVLDNYGEGYEGLTLREFVSQNNAICGINAGGFEDPDGGGTGSIPDGLVISGGKIAYGEPDKEYKNVIGFDENHILHVGSMTGQEALDAGIVEAVSFALGPTLIRNGTPANQKSSLGGGINPRTCIGQAADGTVLLLVINGRQLDSLGATYDDLVEIMLSFGAVNAANLDGGSSALMVYDGEPITRSAYVFGERKLPNAFIVE